MALYTFRRQDLTLPHPAETAFFDEEMRSAALEALEFYAITDLTPVVFDARGEINWVACDFAAKVRRVERSPLTADTYAREVDVFSRYLAAQHGKNLEDATELELWAYRRYRLEGPLQTRVTQTTWNKIAAALLRLKRHLAIPGEIAWRAFRGGRDSSGGRVRMIGIEQFKEFREKGMRSSPRSPLRNVAFAELLVTTGIRCSEGAHLLVDELPQPRRFAAHSMVELHLPASITKGRIARVAHYSRRVANGPIRDYLDEERAHVAHRLLDRHFRSQHVSASSLANTGDWIFFESEFDRARIVAGEGVGAVKPFSHFQPEERSRLVRVTSSGRKYRPVDFAALWISEQRPVVSRAGWGAAFKQASARAGGPEALGREVSPHTLRHTFAVRTLHHLLAGLVDIRRQRPLTGKRGEIYELLIGDPLRTLQHLLGHARYSSTKKYLTYMEDNAELVVRAADGWERDLG